MEEERENVIREKKGGAAMFLTDILRGAAIGVAFIIPGFSGGSVAAILGVYEKIVNAVADLFKHFRTSVSVLLPYALGMILGVALLLLPIGWGLRTYPIPTVSLFVGMSLGGLPSVSEKCKGKPKLTHATAFVLSLIVAASLAFLPVASLPEGFLFHLDIWGYLLLMLAGAAAACALVVPGISGSMLLLIFGYYTPIVELLTDHLFMGKDVGVSLLVVMALAVGIFIGFFLVSLLMKRLLVKYPRGTHCAILGFILGAVVAVYATTVRSTPSTLDALYMDPWYWLVTALLLVVGIALSYSLVCFVRKRQAAEGKSEAENGHEK